ncbi:unnamed protein product (macronuclear) [Paramecium tetraurelia]|uniref:C2H2-type domain-containing protein n=1 Tax=Paramecium tetraurelia TaxID=5888 RepID=A0BDC8_PARTE|nr:uncharacterized protein GSPATT00027573001 [Paramecium tetraurelia]CAK56545.1 unnamed protein product [Paramecium tetraurelia]|eukprot:XP_001423943.1 hypothetical protein (macronuclear) [Paramecium tetraurelia strain d4-2]
MKFIPLTQHYQTIALIYEKCADISKQIDSLSQQKRLNVQIENEETISQIRTNSQVLEQENIKKHWNNLLQEQINQKNEKQIMKKHHKKQLNKKKSKIFGKTIGKGQLKQKVQATCNHCNKIFETQKLYQRHQYQLMYRKKLQNRKLIKLKTDTNQIEDKEQNENKISLNPKGIINHIDSIEICI